MKKILAFIIIISSLISFSYAFEIFGVNFPSSKYGGAVIVYPVYPLIFGVAGDYEIGLPIQGVEGLYVFFGPTASFLSMQDVGSVFSIGANLEAIYLLKQWSFNLLSRKWYPAVGAYLTANLINIGQYHKDYVDFDIYLSIYTPTNSKGSYMYVYFWPWPIIFGFSLVNF
ncbi:MAG: hypothetical protein CBR30_02945 [Dictyoglomus sp. NZ13-RE01]|nr:MAG: hypothetical protein CBR30_02945 [Dictyoglomus sp. NZ13-RE01]